MPVNNHKDSQMNEQEAILKRISEARNPSEPSEPTEAIEPEAEAITEVVDEAETTSHADVTESEDLDEPTLEASDEEELYVELDGREISLNDIKEWEQGSLRQSDYTRKTQELAEQRKALEAKQSEFESKIGTFDTTIVEMESLLEAKDREINWDELREYDPSEYLKQKELKEARQTALEKAKSERSEQTQQQTQAQAQAELERLVTLNPNWIESGKETQAYKSDMNMVREYLTDLGLTEEQQQGILLSGHGQAYIDAAKFHKQGKNNAVVAKKVKKAPVVTKPKGRSVSVSAEAIRKAEAAHKKYGTIHTAMALDKAKRNAA